SVPACAAPGSAAEAAQIAAVAAARPILARTRVPSVLSAVASLDGQQVRALPALPPRPGGVPLLALLEGGGALPGGPGGGGRLERGGGIHREVSGAVLSLSVQYLAAGGGRWGRWIEELRQRGAGRGGAVVEVAGHRRTRAEEPEGLAAADGHRRREREGRHRRRRIANAAGVHRDHREGGPDRLQDEEGDRSAGRVDRGIRLPLRDRPGARQGVGGAGVAGHLVVDVTAVATARHRAGRLGRTPERRVGAR